LSFRVFWSAHAEEQLEEIFHHAADRPSLARVAREIDHFLAAEPRDFGESRQESVRIGFILPLGVLYDVLDDVATVIVYDVWHVSPR
jgi:plasmid stabilization system protein ParE